MDDPFIARLLSGPNNVKLSAEDLALLEAYLRQPVSFATIQRERKTLGRSPTQEGRKKLKLIRDFNRGLRATGGADEAKATVSTPDAAAPGPSAATKPGEGGKRAGRSRGIPLAEAEIKVREWLLKHAKDDPAGITRDAVAAGTGVSAGQVSKTAAWKAFRERRDAEAKGKVREVPLTGAMLNNVPGDCKTPDELAALIEEQRADEAEEYRRYKRRYKRRHKPS